LKNEIKKSIAIFSKLANLLIICKNHNGEFKKYYIEHNSYINNNIENIFLIKKISENAPGKYLIFFSKMYILYH